MDAQPSGARAMGRDAMKMNFCPRWHSILGALSCPVSALRSAAPVRQWAVN